MALLQVHLLCTWRWTWLCLSILAFSSSSWVWLIPCWAPSLLFCNEHFLMTISVKHLLLECSYPFSDCNITFLILIEFTITLLLSEWHLWHLKQNSVVLFLSWSPQHSRLDHSVITVDLIFAIRFKAVLYAWRCESPQFILVYLHLNGATVYLSDHLLLLFSSGHFVYFRSDLTRDDGRGGHLKALKEH